MSTITIIAPCLAETAATGFELGAEKAINGAMWRVDFYTTGELRTYRNGVLDTTPTRDVPRAVLEFVSGVLSYTVEPLRKMKQAATPG